MTRLPIPGSDNDTWGNVLNDFLSASHNSDGSLRTASVVTAGAEMTANKSAANGYAALDSSSLLPANYFGNPLTAPLTDKGSQVFNVKAYGATGDGMTNDTAAIQTAIDAAAPQKGTVFLPAGTYLVNSPLTITSGVTFIGVGDGSIIKAGANISAVLTISVGGDGRGVLRDFQVIGNSLAVNCINQSITSETSVGTRYVRVHCSGATSYQFVNNQCEDVSYIDCSVDGNESNPASTPYALQINVPGGAIRIFGGEWFGKCDLAYQQISVHGAVIGPVCIENPGTSNDTILHLAGCYIYDGGPNQESCIDTSNNLTNVILDGCYLVAQSQPHWINGNMPGYVSIDARNCIWIHGSAGTAGTCALLQASGSGSFTVTGGSTSLLSGDTLALLNPVASAITIARMPIQCIGVPAYTSLVSAPAIPASGSPLANNFATTMMVYVSGGTVSSIAIGGTATGLVSGMLCVPPSQTITLAYTAAPTWTWFAAS